MKQLAQLLHKYGERIDAATLRERVLLFAAAAVVIFALADWALLGPLNEREKKLQAGIAANRIELETIENQIRNMVNARGVDPDAGNRVRRQELTDRIARLDAAIAEDQGRFTPPDRMRAVLEEALRAGSGLRLVQLRALPAAVIAEGPALATSLDGGAARMQIYRHGFELTVSGNYAELHAYVRALEKIATRIYWGKAVLSVSEYPSTSLTLTVYTLSPDKVWIQV